MINALGNSLASTFAAQKTVTKLCAAMKRKILYHNAQAGYQLAAAAKIMSKRQTTP